MKEIPPRFRNERVLSICRRVMDLPEGPTGKEYRRLVKVYVKGMGDDEKADIVSRREEIEERSWDEYLLNKQIFLELGFTDAEASFYAKCRINSPGIREIITERVGITAHATDEEIKKINAGDGSIINALHRIYIVGGIK